MERKCADAKRKGNEEGKKGNGVEEWARRERDQGRRGGRPHVGAGRQAKVEGKRNV